MSLTTYNGPKPNLSFWQIWNMCFGFFGIQFGWSLQMNNMSSIYTYLGADADKIPGLWLAAPMTGLIVQPIIGYLSDRTWHKKLGRRKPYFLIGAILSSLLLFIMPNSTAVWMAAGSLWILDTCINISMEPTRAFVADNLNDKQRPLGFSMQSMFIGAAAFIAGFMPMILAEVFNISRSTEGGKIPDNIKYSFYIGGFMFISAVLYTIFKSKEYPPTIDNLPQQQSAEKGDKTNIIQEIIQSIKNMPTVMKKIALVQFFTWPGLFLMWFFYTDGVAFQIFNATSKDDVMFTKGVEFAGTTYSIENLVTFLFALTLPFLAKRFGNAKTHMICLLLGAIGLLTVRFVTEPKILYLNMTLIGIAWASILAMPYAILAGSLPSNKIGIYMGIFNFFIVLPEIIASLSFGYIMKNFLDNNRLMAVFIGGCLLLLSALLCLRIKDEKSYILTN